MHAAIDAGDLGYTEPAGLPAAFAGFVADEHGWPVDPADVLVVPDVMAGIVEVLRAAGEPGTPVVVNPPVYSPFFDGIPEAGRTVLPVPLARTADGGYRLDLAGLEAAFRAGARTYLLCSPHNPVGRVWDAAELRGVAELVARYDVLVLSDEIHAPLTLAGARHVPFPTLVADRCVAFWSASKAWNTAGLKCALAVGTGPRDRELLARLPAELPYRAGILGVVASTAAFTEGRDWLAALRTHLERNRVLLGELLAERLPLVRYVPPEAGYLAWLDLSGYGLGDDPAAVLLERGRVALVRGLDFGPPGAGFARLNIGTSRTLLTEAVDRIAAAVR
jgi:cystathionine beta-lyase